MREAYLAGSCAVDDETKYGRPDLAGLMRQRDHASISADQFSCDESPFRTMTKRVDSTNKSLATQSVTEGGSADPQVRVVYLSYLAYRARYYSGCGVTERAVQSRQICTAIDRLDMKQIDRA